MIHLRESLPHARWYLIRPFNKRHPPRSGILPLEIEMTFLLRFIFHVQLSGTRLILDASHISSTCEFKASLTSQTCFSVRAQSENDLNTLVYTASRSIREQTTARIRREGGELEGCRLEVMDRERERRRKREGWESKGELGEAWVVVGSESMLASLPRLSGPLLHLFEASRTKSAESHCAYPFI